MSLIKTLRQKGIVATKLVNKGEDFRKKWEHAFANGMSLQEKKSIYLDQYLWHVFSYEKLPCFEREEAMNAFNSETKNVCYLFYQNDHHAYMLMNAENLKAEDLENEFDVYVVDQHFTWTYVHTHEDFCGPYFYRKSRV
ncbi:DUF4275 family protein [Thermolongibacillus altinsuensis]|jgi:hypothetical protein